MGLGVGAEGSQVLCTVYPLLVEVSSMIASMHCEVMGYGSNGCP